MECALACAVIVARADGDLCPEELDAIEDVFARVVPGWSELLDLDVAHARFYETGGMVRAAGPDLIRSLFLLLTHVMAADDVVDGRELEMVLAIGEALGVRAQFRVWLLPVIEAMGVEIEIDALDVSTIPLPVREREVTDALEALCESVQRRGELQVSPRRLLRLVGKPEASDEALAEVAALLAARSIELRPPLEEAGLDELVLLTTTRRTTPGTVELTELDASRQSLIAAVTRLRDELVSGDGRSPSVRLRTLRLGRAFDLTRLDQVRPGTAERVLQLVGTGRKTNLVSAEDAGPP